jgi:CheY-like chemotaxis protein
MTYSSEYRKYIFEFIEKANFLLQHLKQDKNDEKLSAVIENIISASRLEDHPQISISAKYAKNIVDALYSGNIKTNADIINTLREAFCQMKDNLSITYTRDVDSNLIKKFNMILESAKHDEHDYLIMKNIRVLYVDGDEFAQYAVRRECINKSILLEPCSSAREALIRLKNEPFDAVLCDLKLSDPDTLEIFRQYSHEAPIIAISISENPKFVQVAAKAGAMDYVVKSKRGAEMVPRTLHGAMNEWFRRVKSSERDDDIRYYLNLVLEEVGKYKSSAGVQGMESIYQT